MDPDTQHLYAAYGRGNIPQLERQKLMTGTSEYGGTCEDSNATQHTKPWEVSRAQGKPERAEDMCPDFKTYGYLGLLSV